MAATRRMSQSISDDKCADLQMSSRTRSARWQVATCSACRVALGKTTRCNATKRAAQREFLPPQSPISDSDGENDRRRRRIT